MVWPGFDSLWRTLYGLLTKVKRIYNQYISGCISVTKMNQVSSESLVKDILFVWISTVADRRTEPRRRRVRYDPNFARCTV